jgi:hypothetical protein
MSANLLEVISDKAKLIDFLRNKENSVYWQRYSSFYNYFYNTSINKEVFNPEDQILDDNKVLELLYSNNLSGLVKINENLEIDHKELLVYLCLYFMLNISSKELGLKIYSELKKISKEKISILSKEYAKEINITKDNCFFSEGLIMEIAAAEELKYETNNIKKNRLLLENIKNIVENHYKNVCIILAYCYYDKDLVIL